MDSTARNNGSQSEGQAFGTLLRRYRLAAGLTQEGLAERAQVSRRSITDIERGVGHTPRKTTIGLLAEALALGAEQRAALLAAARQQPVQHGSGSRPGVVKPPPLVGRARDLTVIEDHLSGQGPPLLLLAGEPGIGKTRLLQAAAARAADLGLRVLQDGCVRRGDQLPYAPILGALHRHIRTQTPAQRQKELGGCAWLVRLLPELADQGIEPLPAWTVAPAHERRLLFDAVVRFLRNAAGPAGILLVLDDLQWAGADALDLLAMLARTAEDVPLRLLGAYRDTEVQPEDALSGVLADLAQARQATRLLLGPLAPPQAEQLLQQLWAGRGMHDSMLWEHVLQRAGGVPFFMISLAQAASQGAVEEAQGDAIPWDVEQSVRQRVAALPVATRDVLGAAGVLGRVVSPPLLADVTGRPEQEVAAAIDTACQARLLEATGEGAYQFVHDIIREVVEVDAGAARRAVLHRRIGEALEQGSGAPIERLAYHFARSNAPARALHYLEVAGDRARGQSAHTAAEAFYRDLIVRLDARGAVLHGARAREKLGVTLMMVARYTEALEVLEHAAAAFEQAADREGVWRVLAVIGRAHAGRDTPNEGLARLQPLREALETSPPTPATAALLGALAWLLLACGQHRDSIAAATQAAEHARALGDDSVLADVEVRRARALVELGQVETGRKVAESALPLLEVAGNLEALSRVWNNLGDVYKVRGEFAQGQVCRARALDAARRSHDPLATQWALAGLGELLFLRGDWLEARDHLERAATVGRSSDRSLTLHFRLYAQATLHLAEGRWEDLASCLEEGMSREGRRQDAYYGIDLRRLLVERDLLTGDPEAARARLAGVPEGAGAARSIEEPALRTLLAWTHLELGDTARAAAGADRAVAQARAMVHRLSLVEALRVQALVAVCQERCDDARQALEEGVELARHMPYPYAEARLHEASSALCHALGRGPQARAEMQLALRLFRALGAGPHVERVEHALLALAAPRAAEQGG